MNRLSAALSLLVMVGALWTGAVGAQTQTSEIKIIIPKVDVSVPGLTINQEGTTHTIMNNHQTVTLECKKEAVSIMGNNNEITIKGDCTNVSVQGNHNKVIIESVPTLSVAGNHNTITVTAVDNASLSGNYNSLTWTKGLTGEANISNLGRDNTVTKATPKDK